MSLATDSYLLKNARAVADKACRMLLGESCILQPGYHLRCDFPGKWNMAHGPPSVLTRRERRKKENIEKLKSPTSKLKLKLCIIYHIYSRSTLTRIQYILGSDGVKYKMLNTVILYYYTEVYTVCIRIQHVLVQQYIRIYSISR